MFRLGSAAAVGLCAGCTAAGPTGADRDRTERPTTADRESPVAVRLTGPETDRLLFDDADVSDVGTVRDRSGSFVLPVTLTDGVAAFVGEILRAVGADDSLAEFDVVVRGDGSTVDRFGVAPDLARSIAENEWDGSLVLTFDDRSDADEIGDLLT